jgi:vacuolar protein sorting-associated protein 8
MDSNSLESQLKNQLHDIPQIEVTESPLNGPEVADEEMEAESPTIVGESTREIVTNLPQFYERSSHQEYDRRETNDDSDVSSVDKGPDSEEVSITESSTVEVNSTQESLLAGTSSVITPSHSRQTSIVETDTSLPVTPDSVKIRSIDTRFQTRLSSLSSLNSNTSNIFKRHLRNVSQISAIDDLLDSPSLQLEAVRWTKLRKLSSQVYSDSAMVSYGQPSIVFPSSTIAIGTEKGFVLVFDYHQNLLHVLGQKHKTFEWGSVTALCVSADQSFIGVGYAYGHITTWDLRSPQSPHTHIRPLKTPPLVDDSVQQRHGHLEGASVLHLSFMGKRRTALVSGDVRGMAFFHDSKRSFMARTTRTVRLLGRYPDGVTKKKPTTIFGCSPRSLGTEFEKADELCLVAIMTPYMLAIISALPHPRTHFKVSRDKASMDTMGLSGCLSWFPALKSPSGLASKPAVPSRLAYCWSNILRIVSVSQVQTRTDEIGLTFDNSKSYTCDEGIVGVQWINRQVCDK